MSHYNESQQTSSLYDAVSLHTTGEHHDTYFAAPRGDSPSTLSHAAIVKAIQSLNNRGVPITVLPTLLQQACLEPLSILLAAVQRGLSSSQLRRLIQYSIMSAEEVLPLSRTSSNVSSQLHRVASMNSYQSRRSGLSGETLLSSPADIYRSWNQHGAEAMTQMQDEETTVKLPHNWPEEELHQSASYNAANRISLLNKVPISRDEIDYSGMDQAYVRRTESSFTDMLQNNTDAGQTSWLDEDESIIFTDQHVNFQNSGNIASNNHPAVLQSGLHETRTAVTQSFTPDRMLHDPSRAGVHNFVGWSPRKPKEPTYRSPCPRCQSDFVSPTEFMAHVKGKHDMPIKFTCKHVKGLGKCDYETCASARFSKHHTEEHKDCTWFRGEGIQLSPCHDEIPNTRPKRVWGCWFCTWCTTNVENWIRHHMQAHKDRPRKEMSHTLLMKSLLSQDILKPVWQKEMKRLEEKTKCTWNIQWYAGEEPTRDALIRAMETGYWHNEDMYSNQGARQALVSAAMKATEQTRTELDRLPGHNQHTTKRHPSGSPSPPKHPKTLRLALRRSKSTLKPAPLDISAPIGHMQQVLPTGPTSRQVLSIPGTGAKEQHGLSSSFGAAHDDEVHMFSC